MKNEKIGYFASTVKPNKLWEYLAFSAKINSERNDNLFLVSDDFKISCKFINAEYEIINSNYFPSFGKMEDNKCIKIMPTNNEFNCKFSFINL